jgi:hypothetical protein
MSSYKPFSETKIQYYLMKMLQSKHYLFANNIKIFGNNTNSEHWYKGTYESDFISVSFNKENNTCWVFEYEIKRTKSDFMADFNKPRYNWLLRTLAKTNIVDKVLPNRFYYVCPWGVIDKELVPKYAGLIYIHSNGRLETIKKAPKIHNKQIGTKSKFVSQISRSMCWRAIESKLSLGDRKRK